jgi:hypothetical protein
VFGNQGGLFMNAMTWWDHATESVWSQPWGRAIAGTLKGTELELLSSELVPWGTWRERHPHTLALETDVPGMEGRNYHLEVFYDGFVIGVALGDHATAFPYRLAADKGIINDSVGTDPVVVYVDKDKDSTHVYLRQVNRDTLTFVFKDGAVMDQETGSIWALATGIAVDGPLKGKVLRSAPYIPAFDEAWHDFYPQSRWYEEP